MVTTYSPAGAPSPSLYVVRRNDPSSSTYADGLFGSASAVSTGWKMTKAPAAGSFLAKTWPCTGYTRLRPLPHEGRTRVRHANAKRTSELIRQRWGIEGTVMLGARLVTK